MAWTNPTQRTTGTLITSSIYNTDIIDNLVALRETIRYYQIEVFSFANATNNAAGDGAAYFIIPAGITSGNIVEVRADVLTAGTTGTEDIQIHNVTDAVDVLSTKMTIDSGETSTDTAATAAVINTSNDDVATGDLLRIDIDAVHSTAAVGLIVTVGIQVAGS